MNLRLLICRSASARSPDAVIGGALQASQPMGSSPSVSLAAVGGKEVAVAAREVRLGGVQARRCAGVQSGRGGHPGLVLAIPHGCRL